MEKGEGEERTQLPELDYANQYAGPAAVEPTVAPASRAGAPASPRLEMSMRTPDRGFRRGDTSGESEEEEEREAGACGRMMLAIHSAVSHYSYAWETLLRFCGIALAAYVGCFLRIACSRIRIMQVGTIPHFLRHDDDHMMMMMMMKMMMMKGERCKPNLSCHLETIVLHI